MFVTAGAHRSEAESRMVETAIDEMATENSILVCVASDTENKAQKTWRLIVGEQNRISCFAHIIHLAVNDS